MNERLKGRDDQREPQFRVRIVCAALLTVSCLAFIWTNSLMSPEMSASISDAFSAALVRLLSVVFGENSWITREVQEHIRKIAHAVEFFILGALSAVMLTVIRRATWHFTLHAMFFILLAAVADETIQVFTDRGSAVQDVVLDFAAGVTGLLILSCALGIRRRAALRRGQ